MYQPDGRILWDAWFVEVDGVYHAYYLQAPRGLADPEERHLLAEVGHAVSDDLATWRDRGVALAKGRDDAFDGRAVWSGGVAVVDGLAHLFYTGIPHGDVVQRVGRAVSADLDRFVRTSPAPLLEADPVWYETAGGPDDHVHWRDPHPVVVDGRLHLFLSARARHGPWDERGTIALATSDDWRRWTVHPPVAELGHFAQLEVPQVVERGGRWWMVVSADARWQSTRRRERLAGAHAHTGLAVLVADAVTGPYVPARDAFLLGDEIGTHYTGKIVPTPNGDRLVASRFRDATGAFVGALCPPAPVEWRPDGPHVDADLVLGA